jgi:alpha-galactosidase/6-phospho-beta-glucosidase family protein
VSEERLQEIKDSISRQYKVQETNDLDSFNIFTDEEQELIDEIERLNNIIKEVKEYIEKNKVDLSWFMTTDKDLKLEGISNVVSTFRLLELLDKGE